MSSSTNKHSFTAARVVLRFPRRRQEIDRQCGKAKKHNCNRHGRTWATKQKDAELIRHLNKIEVFPLPRHFPNSKKSFTHLVHFVIHRNMYKNMITSFGFRFKCNIKLMVKYNYYRKSIDILINFPENPKSILEHYRRN